MINKRQDDSDSDGLQACSCTLGHYSKPQAQYSPSGLTPSGKPYFFPSRGGYSVSIQLLGFFNYFRKARAYVTVTCSHRARVSALHCTPPPPPPLLAFLSRPHPPISISHACSCAGLTVRASPCRAPAASATQKGRSSRSWAYLGAEREEESR